MTGPEHYVRAGELLAEASLQTPDGAAKYIAMAEVHERLARTAAFLDAAELTPDARRAWDDAMGGTS